MGQIQGPAIRRRPFFLAALTACLALAAGLPAAFRPVGGAVVEVFGPAKAWVSTPARLLYQAQPEAMELRLAGLRPGHALNARLQVDKLPGYSAWLAQRQAEGGAAWGALQGLLQDLAGQPVVLLTHAALPAEGPAKVLVGLRKGARFELYASLDGQVQAQGQGLSFSPQSVAFESAKARLAWQLLAPLARAQARRVAGQKP